MPIIYEKQISPDCKTYVWEITENIDDLTYLLTLNSKELEELENFKLAEKKLQWLATKTLLQQVFKTSQRIKTQKNEFGKPYLVDLPFEYSLSHSSKYVAITISKRAVGVDIELVRNKIERIADKFMSDIDFAGKPEVNVQEYYHVIWGAKEALFKLYGKGEVIFKDDLLISAFQFSMNGGITEAIIKKNDAEILCNIHYQCINECILVTAEQKI